MSILITYGNKNEVNMISDSRITSIHEDGSIDYNEHGQKVFKINKTLIGMVGDVDYFRCVINKIKSDPIFITKRGLINAQFETIYELFNQYLKQEKDNFEHSSCKVSICGIDFNNQIVMDVFSTENFDAHHKIKLNDETYRVTVFCNGNESYIAHQIWDIVTNQPKNDAFVSIHSLIIEKFSEQNDSTININLNCESIHIN